MSCCALLCFRTNHFTVVQLYSGCPAFTLSQIKDKLLLYLLSLQAQCKKHKAQFMSAKANKPISHTRSSSTPAFPFIISPDSETDIGAFLIILTLSWKDPT